MASKVFNVVALVTFSALAVQAFNYIIGHAQASGLYDKLGAHCHANVDGLISYRLPYTGIAAIDEILCNIVAFFHVSFEPEVKPALAYLLISAIPIVSHPFFEAHRPSSPFVLGYPVIITQLMQILSFGASFSVYWMVFILSGAAQTRSGPKSTITKAQAQAVLFGVLLGMILLSGCLFAFQDPFVTAIWQISPIVVATASFVQYTATPTTERQTDSGYPLIRGFYLASFLLISSVHITMLTTKNPEELKALFLPSVDILPSSTSAALQALNVLQWDGVFGLGASVLATLWFGQNVTEVLALLVCNVLASPLVGPGAAFAASALWRESRLHRDFKSTKTE
ncbi:hypothetical protein BDP27DRAFT_1417750 [Rhodocollybia butyracea]|uniref:Vomeronasal type-1 receptor n=1 Tax=Rhodocollybia butyracea TaxID=206335 RepID=A0A9P5Q2N3_9AGAR|nr:hypothetical protein BDP27DRAFT_1417750 [Rhodocollybia butyracea]